MTLLHRLSGHFSIPSLVRFKKGIGPQSSKKQGGGCKEEEKRSRETGPQGDAPHPQAVFLSFSAFLRRVSSILSKEELTRILLIWTR